MTTMKFLHSYVEIENQVLSVGRAHLISDDSDGSAADHAGPDATKCPGFGPLKEKNNRPAIQIRQMGTLPEARRKGFAAEVLANLETESRPILVQNSVFYKQESLLSHFINRKVANN